MADDLLFKPATELAQLVRDGEVTSRELTEASLARIEALDGEVNAFMHLDADGALAAADAVEAGDARPFAGVPIAIKDTAAVAGMPFTFGAEIFGDFVPGHDAFAVRRLRDAGFVIVGKTSMPEFGILPVSEPRRSPTAATAAARSASPPPAAAWSASSPPAAASRAGRSSATISSSRTGR